MKLTEKVPRYIPVYVPMLIGGLLGFCVSKVGGWPAVAGMVAGAVSWLAWEMRKSSRSVDRMLQLVEMRRQMDAELDESIPQADKPWVQ